MTSLKNLFFIVRHGTSFIVFQIVKQFSLKQSSNMNSESFQLNVFWKEMSGKILESKTFLQTWMAYSKRKNVLPKKGNKVQMMMVILHNLQKQTGVSRSFVREVCFWKTLSGKSPQQKMKICGLTKLKLLALK